MGFIISLRVSKRKFDSLPPITKLQTFSQGKWVYIYYAISDFIPITEINEHYKEIKDGSGGYWSAKHFGIYKVNLEQESSDSEDDVVIDTEYVSNDNFGRQNKVSKVTPIDMSKFDPVKEQIHHDLEGTVQFQMLEKKDIKYEKGEESAADRYERMRARAFH